MKIYQYLQLTLFFFFQVLICAEIQAQTNPVFITPSQKVLKAEAIDAQTIVLEFDQPLNVSAENKNNFQGLNIRSAERGLNKQQVILNLNTPLELGIFYPLQAQNLKSLNGDAIQDEEFEVVFNNSLGEMVISEIMYNNPGPDTIEFIELTNNSGTDLQLGGWRFTDGIDYVFPTTTVLAGDRIVVARYPYFDIFFGTPAQHWFTGGLNNNGERLELRNANLDIIDYLTYADSAPWDTLPDGDGYSLVLCDLNSDNALPYSWEATSFNDYAGNLTGFGGVYAVPGTTADACPPVSVLTTNAPSIFKLYPNPANDQLSIEWDQEEQFKDLRIRLYNAYGQIVKEMTPEQDEVISLNLDGLISGIYFLSIFADEQVYSHKIQIQK